MKFWNRWRAILAGLAGAGAIAGGISIGTGGGSKPPAPIPAETLAMWTRTCEALWQEELGRAIDTSGLESCLAQSKAGGTAETIRANVRKDPAWADHQEDLKKAKEEAEKKPAVVSLPPLATSGPIFTANGQPWRWKGVTAFKLLDEFAKGEDIGPFLEDFKGFNVLRIFPYVPVKDWHASAWDQPSSDVVIAFLERVEREGFYVELVLLTDDDAGRLEPARRLVEALTAARPPNLILEVGNEPQTHKAINTAAMKASVMASGFLVSSGDYEDSRRWYGHWIGFHSARDGEWPRRAHDALDYTHGGGPNFPEEPALKVPAVCDEPIRPDQAGYNDADYRAYFGTCSLLGGGGTFHFESGKHGNRPTPDEKRIAGVVLAALNAFPADAPKGPYRRPVEQSLRTYQVGPWMTRVRPETPTYPDGGWTALEPSGVLWRRN